MAAVTAAGATWNTTTGTHTVTATPAASDQIVIFCANTGITTTPTVTDDQGGTYTLGPSALHNTSASKMFAFVRDALIPAAISTVFSATGASSNGGGLFVFRVSGMSKVGAAALLQSGSQANQAAGTPAPAFPAPATTANVLMGAVMTATNGAANCAPPVTPNWTESHDQGYATPTTGFETCWIDSGDTRTTVTFGAATPSVFAAVIVELDTSSSGVTGTGAITAAAASFSGTGTEEFAGTGDLAAAAASFEGTGTSVEPVTGTGDLAAAAASFAGVGTQTVAAPPIITGKPRKKKPLEFLPVPLLPVKGTGDFRAAPASLHGVGEVGPDPRIRDDEELLLLL